MAKNELQPFSIKTGSQNDIFVKLLSDQAQAVFDAVSKIDIVGFQEKLQEIIEPYIKHFEESNNRIKEAVKGTNGQGSLADRIATYMFNNLVFGDIELGGQKITGQQIKDAILELQRHKRGQKGGLESLTSDLEGSSPLKIIYNILSQSPSSDNLIRLKNQFDTLFSSDKKDSPAGFLYEGLTTLFREYVENNKELGAFYVAGGKRKIEVNATDIIQRIKTASGEIITFPISLKLKTIQMTGNKTPQMAIGNTYRGSSIQNFFMKRNSIFKSFGTLTINGAGVVSAIDAMESAALHYYIYKRGEREAARNKIKILCFLNGLMFILLGDKWRRLMEKSEEESNESGTSYESYMPQLIGSYEQMVTTYDTLQYFKNIIQNEQLLLSLGTFAEKWQGAASRGEDYQAKLNQLLQGKDNLGTARYRVTNFKRILLDEEATRLRAGKKGARSYASAFKKAEGKRSPLIGEKGNKSLIDSYIGAFPEIIKKLAKVMGVSQQEILKILTSGATSESGIPRPNIPDYMKVEYHIAINNITNSLGK